MNEPIPPPTAPQFIFRPRRATKKKAANTEDMDVDSNAGGGDDYEVPVTAMDDPVSWALYFAHPVPALIRETRKKLKLLP